MPSDPHGSAECVVLPRESRHDWGELSPFCISWALTDPTVMFVFYFVRRDEPGDTIHTLNEVLSTRRREASSKEHCLFGFQDGDCETGLGSNEGLRRLRLASHRVLKHVSVSSLRHDCSKGGQKLYTKPR